MVCYPGITEAKSIDTIVCTEVQVVAKPIETKDTSSNVANLLARPLQPKLSME
jgi:hypothetical protein